MRRPWLKFWPGDWRGDPKLRACSLVARAVWIELICLMHEGTPYGHCTLGGAALSVKELSALVGAPTSQVASGLAELERLGVLSRTDKGVIYSRRMVRDEAQREEGKTNGKRGGNPTLSARDGITQGVNPPGQPGGITPPSTPREPLASSGSSESLELNDPSLRSGSPAPTGAGGLLPGIGDGPPTPAKREPSQAQIDRATVQPIWLELWFAKFGKPYLGLKGSGKSAPMRAAALRNVFVRLERDEAAFREHVRRFLADPPFKARQNPDPIALQEFFDSVQAGLSKPGPQALAHGTPRSTRRPDGTRPGEYPEPIQFPRVVNLDG